MWIVELVLCIGFFVSAQAGEAFVSSNIYTKRRIDANCNVWKMREQNNPSSWMAKSDRWQDLAEYRADPLKSPFDKPAVLQKLLGRTKDIQDSLNSIVSGKVFHHISNCRTTLTVWLGQASLEDELLSSNAKRQVNALRSVRRQLLEDILPDSQRALEKWIAEPRLPAFRPQDITNVIVEQLDEVTSTGKLRPPPSPADVIKSIVEESKNLFQSTPDLETPDYKVWPTHCDVRNE